MLVHERRARHRPPVQSFPAASPVDRPVIPESAQRRGHNRAAAPCTSWRGNPRIPQADDRTRQAPPRSDVASIQCVVQRNRPWGWDDRFGLSRKTVSIVAGRSRHHKEYGGMPTHAAGQKKKKQNRHESPGKLPFAYFFVSHNQPGIAIAVKTGELSRIAFGNRRH